MIHHMESGCRIIENMESSTLKGINWNDLPTEQKRGSCCRKNDDGSWFIDDEIPIFSQNTDYVNSRIVFE